MLFQWILDLWFVFSGYWQRCSSPKAVLQRPGFRIETMASYTNKNYSAIIGFTVFYNFLEVVICELNFALMIYLLRLHYETVFFFFSFWIAENKLFSSSFMFTQLQKNNLLLIIFRWFTSVKFLFHPYFFTKIFPLMKY